MTVKRWEALSPDTMPKRGALAPSIINAQNMVDRVQWPNCLQVTVAGADENPSTCDGPATSDGNYYGWSLSVNGTYHVPLLDLRTYSGPFLNISTIRYYYLTVTGKTFATRTGWSTSCGVGALGAVNYTTLYIQIIMEARTFNDGIEDHINGNLSHIWVGFAESIPTYNFPHAVSAGGNFFAPEYMGETLPTQDLYSPNTIDLIATVNSTVIIVPSDFN